MLILKGNFNFIIGGFIMWFEIIQKDKKGKLSGYEYKTLSGAVNTLLRMIYHPPFGEYEIFFKCKNK